MLLYVNFSAKDPCVEKNNDICPPALTCLLDTNECGCALNGYAVVGEGDGRTCEGTNAINGS